MKISEVIDRLVSTKDNFGDIDVSVGFTNNGVSVMVNPLYEVVVVFVGGVKNAIMCAEVQKI